MKAIKGTFLRMRTNTIQTMMRIAGIALFFCMASALPLAAQAPAFDTSGNSMLSGTYYFRHVLYAVGTSADSSGVTGDVSEAVALFGNIAFDGNGNYNITNGVVSDSGVGTSVSLACWLAGAPAGCTSNSGVTGTYSISASGFGFLGNPLVAGDLVYGLVSANGVFSGSTTETTSAYNDLFIAALTPSTQPTFSGSYTVAGYLPGEDMFFSINPSGAGSLGTVNVNGYYEGGGTTTISQSSNATYTFSNNAAVVTFPTSSTANFFSGQEYLYFSPDGNFFFGGSPTNGYDMIVGVRNTSGAPNLDGTYYQAGIDQNVSEIGSGYADFDGYYGSFIALSSGNIVAHERLADIIFENATYGWTFSDSFTPPLAGTYTDTDYSVQYAVGAGGAVRIGQGIGPYLGLSVAFQAPAFTPAQPVYINPTGVVNAASFSPFTAGVSNGEFITIFGTNLAAGTVVASSVPYPTKLGNVQVMINGVAAPIYFVSSRQVAVIVPSQNPYPLAQIQVINNGASSNVVTVSVNPTTPGIYTNPSGGVYAAAVDTNSQTIVTPATPAQPGDTIEVFTTGLGTAYPPVPDGAAPPDSPLSQTVNTIQADVNGTSATVLFAGLAPTLAGLYQVNVTIPSTTAAGDQYLDLSGVSPTTQALESYNSQVLISVGSGIAAIPGTPLAASKRGRHSRNSLSVSQRSRPCFAGAKPACTVEK
jgi:uncharacterized protein (TIGR03437 family)